MRWRCSWLTSSGNFSTVGHKGWRMNEWMRQAEIGYMRRQLTYTARGYVVFVTMRETSLSLTDRVPAQEMPQFHTAHYDFCRAMLCQRGLCHHAVSVCLSVCLSVRLSRSWSLSKRTNISSNKKYVLSNSESVQCNFFHFWSRDVNTVQNMLLCTKFHEYRMIFHWDMAM